MARNLGNDSSTHGWSEAGSGCNNAVEASCRLHLGGKADSSFEVTRLKTWTTAAR